MRRALAGIALAVTSMVALSFLIPLALLVREQARDRVTTAAEQRTASVTLKERRRLVVAVRETP
ncbi:two-component sensor histidine kinase, partial [Streptomyces sp. NPDC044948]